MTEITIRRPDDWHVHLRDGALLEAVLPFTARQFGRAIIMPNLQPPITTADMAVAYRERILAALPEGTNFDPLMTLYLTDTTSPADIAAAKATGVVKACKLYPAGATTNSESGVTDLMKLVPTFQAMEVSCYRRCRPQPSARHACLVCPLFSAATRAHRANAAQGRRH